MITCDTPPAAGTGPLRNGNPRGNPNLAPRCGAKTRAGCPCRAPAMPNGRCRMHGGNCRGPSTPEGKARSVAAHAKHGHFTAPRREHRRYVRTLIRRNRLLGAARLLWPYLPPDMAARLAEAPVELSTPIHPSNLPFLTPEQARFYNVTAALDRAHRQQDAGRARKTPPPTVHAYERAAAQAEAAAQAPWRHAIASANKRAHHAAKRQARAAKRADRAARRAARAGQGAAPARATRPDASLTSRSASNSARQKPAPAAWPPDPDPPESQLSLLEREHAARLAGLRPGRHALAPESATPGQNPDSAPTELNAVQREPGPNPHFHPPELNAMQRETGANSDAAPRTAPALTYLTPTKAIALRSTTLACTWDTDLRSTLAAQFGRPPPAWCIPQAQPPIASAGAEWTAGRDKTRNHARDMSAPPYPWPC